MVSVRSSNLLKTSLVSSVGARQRVRNVSTPPTVRLEEIVENVPDDGSIRHRTGEPVKKAPEMGPFLCLAES